MAALQTSDYPASWKAMSSADCADCADHASKLMASGTPKAAAIAMATKAHKAKMAGGK